MTGSKCFQCGFVSSRNNETCKSCGASLNQPRENSRSRVDPGRSKIVYIVPVLAIIALVLGLWLKSTLLSSPPPSPGEVSHLLYADEELTRPLTVDFPTEFTRTASNGDQNEDYVLEDYLEAQVLKKLGLVFVTFTTLKTEKRDCYRYRIRALPPSPFMSGPPSVSERDPNGPYEHCDDVWLYNTKLDFLDPDAVEEATVSERVRNLIDIPLPPPLRNRSSAWREAPVRSTTLTIGSIEIAEISDVVAGERRGTYTVGFKFRLKPNGLGALLDINGPVHKSLPNGIRELFRYKAMDNTEVDKRLTYMVHASKSDGLTFGHADLVREGIFHPQWKIAHLYLDQVDKTPYEFHPIE
ncbi:MAG TPA: hypothetical protein VHS05_30845 [Pyrinomonadaceae bacterium]|nr:hypothetical protein [Pyrinomonadaceae bacterium]